MRYPHHLLTYLSSLTYYLLILEPPNSLPLSSICDAFDPSFIKHICYLNCLLTYLLTHRPLIPVPPNSLLLSDLLDAIDPCNYSLKFDRWQTSWTPSFPMGQSSTSCDSSYSSVSMKGQGVNMKSISNSHTHSIVETGHVKELAWFFHSFLEDNLREWFNLWANQLIVIPAPFKAKGMQRRVEILLLPNIPWLLELLTKNVATRERDKGHHFPFILILSQPSL